jgi:lycopene beta-cyclase
MSRIIIAGGGLAGCLAAIALAKRHPEIDFLLVEQGLSFGGKHTWSFFDTDVPAGLRWVIEDIAALHWREHRIRFPKRKRTIGIGYNSINSAGLDDAVRRVLRPDQYRLGQGIRELGAAHVVLEGGERLEGKAVIDARGPMGMPTLDLGWQKFVGRTYRYDRPHAVDLPVIMDGCVSQRDGYRFIYQLPVSETELLVEDTYYSVAPNLDRVALRDGLDAAAMAMGNAEVIDEEEGVLPVVMGGDVDSLWQGEGAIPFGIRGGFFHPTTGYSLPDAVANAAFLSEQSELSAKSLRPAFHKLARHQWRDRRFYRLLNRMLFRGTDPDKAFRVLEHFYRLPPPVIARFYAARLTSLDKLRILSGRPPVPIGRAMMALRGRAA